MGWGGGAVWGLHGWERHLKVGGTGVYCEGRSAARVVIVLIMVIVVVVVVIIGEVEERTGLAATRDMGAIIGGGSRLGDVGEGRACAPVLRTELDGREVAVLEDRGRDRVGHGEEKSGWLGWLATCLE